MIPIVFRHAFRPRGITGAAALCVAVVAANGCATADQYMPSWRSFGVYKLDVNQGNYLSQDMVDKLKVGMTPGPVSYTHLRAHETPEHLVCRLLLEKKKTKPT